MSKLQAIIEEIDFETAVRQGSLPNDLLPPRHEDKIAGELGKRFAEGLRLRLEHDTYDSMPAALVQVPKPGNTTRPAALLGVVDRILLRALVDLLRPRIESSLLGSGTVMWPRGVLADKQWQCFEKAPLESNKEFVTCADVSAFYESIDHDRLQERLVDATGKRKVVDALLEILTRVMSRRRGLPQGLEPCDALATAYLSPVDSAMARAGFEYYRHGDDIRISASSYREAREALFLLEQELRDCNLFLNNPKSRIVPTAKYAESLRHREKIIAETRKVLLEARIAKMSDDEDVLIDEIDNAKLPELGWAFLYHFRLDFDEVVEELRPHLTASDVEVAARVFQDSMNSLADGHAILQNDEFHQRISSSLVRLTAFNHGAAVPYLSRLLAHSPEKTDQVVSYIKSLEACSIEEGLKQLHELLQMKRFHTPWEKAWFLHLLSWHNGALPAWASAYASGIMCDEEEPSICRAEAVKVVARAGLLEHSTIRRLWNILPALFRTDLVAAVYYAKNSTQWAAAFLDGVKDDPVYAVILRHLEQRSRSI